MPQYGKKFNEFAIRSEEEINEDKMKILRMLKAKLTLSQIETLTKDRSTEYILRICNLLASEGKIKRSVIKAQITPEMEKRRMEKDEKILEYIRRGYTFKEIALSLGCTTNYIYRIRQNRLEEGTWPTKMEIKKYKEQRKRRELEVERKLDRNKREDSNLNAEQQERRLAKWIEEVVNPTVKRRYINNIDEL